MAGNKGFLAIGDWIASYRDQLIDLLKPPKNRLPSYSTIRRSLLHVNYEQYSACLVAALFARMFHPGECRSEFFSVQPVMGETIGRKGKCLRGSYQLEDDNPYSQPHPAIMLVSAYIVERGLILEPFEVDEKTNEIKAIPELIEKLALKGVIFAQ